MNESLLPLIEIFMTLRRREFPLGMSEYLLALEALHEGLGVNSRQELILMYKILWGKSAEEQKQIDDLLRIHLPRLIPLDELNMLLAETDVEEKPTPSTEAREILDPPDVPATLPIIDTKPEDRDVNVHKPSSAPDLSFHFGEHKPEVAIPVVEDKEIQFNSKYDFIGDMPITPRQMKRAWRYYRRMQRVGLASELDIEATLEQRYRRGVFAEFVLVPHRTNMARMLILKDEKGSMTPFNRITNDLLESARTSGLANVKTCFFHDVPEAQVYDDPALTITVPLKQVLTPFAESGVLIISDAGAARGNYDEFRVRKTIQFIRRVKEFTQNIAWLNPTPRERWTGTTAEGIRRECSVAMFTLDRAGLDMAVDALRGRVMEV